MSAVDTAAPRMRVRKRNGSLEPVDVTKIVRAVARSCGGLVRVDPLRVATQTISGLYDGATTRELDELSIRTAASLVVEEPEYGRLAARLLAVEEGARLVEGLGVGGGEGADLEELVYEGYGPGGVAILLEVMTDNRNRTAGEIRHLFTKHGGNLGESGCVAWMFERKGVLSAGAAENGLDEDKAMELALEVGAEDVRQEDGDFVFYSSPEDFERVKKFLEEKNVKFTVSEVTMIPRSTVEVRGKEARQVLSLVEALEDRDDVQQVHTNFDIPAEVMEELAEAR